MRYIVDLEVVRFCAIECRLQMSGELSVWHMINGWVYAQDNASRVPTVDDIIKLGMYVEPSENNRGFRRCQVMIGSDFGVDFEDVPRQINNLVEAIPRLTPNEFFFEYEKIHPFKDGNGRTGQILFNWLNKSLFSPVWAENFFNDPRRTVGYGA